MALYLVLVSDSRERLQMAAMASVAAVSSEPVAARNEGLLRLIDLFAGEEVQRGIADLAQPTCGGREGGVGGLWRVAREPGMQQALRFVALVTHELGRAEPNRSSDAEFPSQTQHRAQGFANRSSGAQAPELCEETRLF